MPATSSATSCHLREHLDVDMQFQLSRGELDRPLSTCKRGIHHGKEVRRHESQKEPAVVQSASISHHCRT